MFNGSGYGGVTSPPLTNNPFIDHTTSTKQRFPDISQPPNVIVNQSESPVWGNGGLGGQYYQAQQQPPQLQTQQPQPQQWQTNNAMSSASHPGMFTTQVQQPQSIGFPSSNSFGQGIVSGSSYNYLEQSQPMQQQLPSYNPVQQQLQSPSYLAQFDPYAAVGQGWGETTTTTTTITSNALSATGTGSSSGPSTQYFSSSHINTPVPSSTQSTSISESGDQHPRDYIRQHKSLIESWDRYTWNMFLELFERLKTSWETRKNHSEMRAGVLATQVATLEMQTQGAGSLGYAGYLNLQQYRNEFMNIQKLLKEAKENFDSVAASTFQMQEVFENYRQSGDITNKKRVREATNAALQSLPDWPRPFFSVLSG